MFNINQLNSYKVKNEKTDLSVTKVSATSVSAKVIRLECLCKIKTREPGNFLNELFEPGTDAYNNICRYKVCSCLVLL